MVVLFCGIIASGVAIRQHCDRRYSSSKQEAATTTWREVRSAFGAVLVCLPGCYVDTCGQCCQRNEYGGEGQKSMVRSWERPVLRMSNIGVQRPPTGVSIGYSMGISAVCAARAERVSCSAAPLFRSLVILKGLSNLRSRY